MAGTWKIDPTSRRTTPRPTGWKALRLTILERDNHRCTWIEGIEDGGTWEDWAHPDRCKEKATDVDHIGDPADHRPENLRALGPWHHDRRSSAQANAARAINQAKRKRPKPQHPGLRSVTGGG